MDASDVFGPESLANGQHMLALLGFVIFGAFGIVALCSSLGSSSEERNLRRTGYLFLLMAGLFLAGGEYFLYISLALIALAVMYFLWRISPFRHSP